MNKQTEALKLALEALEEIALAGMSPAPEMIDSKEAFHARQAWRFIGIAARQLSAIREALAEQPAPPPECQTEAEKTAFAFGWFKALEQKRKADSALDRMAENARELGLDYEPIVEQVEDFVGMGHKAWDMVDPKELAKGFHEALAEPPCKTGSQCTNKCQQCEQPAQQQEPVARSKAYDMIDRFLRNNLNSDEDYAEYSTALDSLYTSPPASKPWVGLTQQDIDIAFDDTQEGGGFNEFARAIEAKLREKNA